MKIRVVGLILALGILSSTSVSAQADGWAGSISIAETTFPTTVQVTFQGTYYWFNATISSSSSLAVTTLDIINSTKTIHSASMEGSGTIEFWLSLPSPGTYTFSLTCESSNFVVTWFINMVQATVIYHMKTRDISDAPFAMSFILLGLISVTVIRARKRIKTE